MILVYLIMGSSDFSVSVSGLSDIDKAITTFKKINDVGFDPCGLVAGLVIMEKTDFLEMFSGMDVNISHTRFFTAYSIYDSNGTEVACVFSNDDESIRLP